MSSIYTYRGRVHHVVDGDTVDLEIDQGFYNKTIKRIRLLGVDTPERGHPDFHLATESLFRLLQEAEDQNGWLYVRTEKTGKYGRWLGIIFSTDESINVNDIMAERWPG